jgi:succinate dehydrogenase flavin-adding protein (antitoxin of CptAB toxin-antitoxin module)
MAYSARLTWRARKRGMRSMIQPYTAASTTRVVYLMSAANSW